MVGNPLMASLLSNILATFITGLLGIFIVPIILWVRRFYATRIQTPEDEWLQSQQTQSSGPKSLRAMALSSLRGMSKRKKNSVLALMLMLVLLSAWFTWDTMQTKESLGIQIMMSTLMSYEVRYLEMSSLMGILAGGNLKNPRQRNCALLRCKKTQVEIMEIDASTSFPLILRENSL